jgi:hypothetical protein
MKTMRWLALSLLIGFLSACATVQTGGDVDQGRQALFAGSNQAALSYFQAAAQTDPNYVYGTELREGVLSYLGRAPIPNRELSASAPDFGTGPAQHKSDNVARLYLGLTQVRLGDRQVGLKNIQAGMNGINNFLNYITTAFAMEFGQFWDPSGAIRASIKSDLAMLSSGNIDWPKLIADGESLGIRIEREADLARQQAEQQREMQMPR